MEEQTGNYNLNQENRLDNLLPEVIQNILLYLPPEDVNSVWNSSKQLRDLYQCDYFWKRQCQKNGYKDLKESSQLAAYEKYLNRFESRWQGIFNYNRILDHNWRNNVSKVLVLNEQKYTALYYFDDEIVVASLGYPSFLYFNGIRFVSHKLHVIDSSTGTIFFLDLKDPIAKVMKQQNMVYFIGEGYIKVWDLQTKKFFGTMVLDFFCRCLNEILSFKMYKNLIGLVHFKKGLFIFDFRAEEVVYADTAAITVGFGKEMVTVGFRNGTIQLLDLNFKNLMIFDFHENVEILDVQVRDDHLLVISKRPDAVYGSVWSLTNGIKLHELKGTFKGNFHFGEIQGNNFVFGSHTFGVQDKIQVWRYQERSAPLMVGHQPQNFQFLNSNSRCLFVMSFIDIGVWCLNAGTMIRGIDDITDQYVEKPFGVTETKYAYIKKNKSLVIHDFGKFVE